MRVLILTVGGSDQPLVKAINFYRPDLTVFLCTQNEGENKGSLEMVDGPGKVCRERPCPFCEKKEREDRDSIVKQTGLASEAYKVCVVPPDDPYRVYETALQVIKEYLEQGAEVIVDYTGGTKSMSVGLAMAAVDYPQCALSLVKGKRLDLVKVRDGLERVARFSPYPLFAERQKKLCRDFVKGWDYFAAAKVLEEMGQVVLPLLPEEEATLERLLILCRGFYDWDRFAYREAVTKIEVYKREPLVSVYNKTLKQICAALDWFEEWTPDFSPRNTPPVFVLVYDVFLNAERRAVQGAFDDAVSRIYRGLEMYGQFCLRTGRPPLKSDDIDVSLLPVEIREDYEKKRGPRGKVQIGLTDDYDLLALLEHPAGAVWKKWRARLLNILNLRNYSFLAHGLSPVTERDYQAMRDAVWDFIGECDEALKIKEGLRKAKQLPAEL
jgi:CRISPR-associated protein (TIGR02710 family)